MKLLCYGTVAGGFLSDRWLGVPEPAEPLENRSLTKYKLIIDDIGGWDFFQCIAASAPHRRGPARRGIADGCDARMCSTGPGSRQLSSAFGTADISPPTRALTSLRLTDRDQARDCGGHWLRKRPWKATSTISNATPPGVMAAS